MPSFVGSFPRILHALIAAKCALTPNQVKDLNMYFMKMVYFRLFYMFYLNKDFCGDWRDELKSIEDES